MSIYEHKRHKGKIEMQNQKVDFIKGRIKFGKTVVYPVPEVISFLKRRAESRPGNEYLEIMFKTLIETNQTGFISRKEIERQTGGLLKSRTLANIDSLSNRQQTPS